MTFLTSLGYKIKGWMMFVGGVAAAIFYVFLKGRSAGVAAERAKVEKEHERIQNKWNEIDNRPVGFDDAVDGLRKRSARR
jgi:hypothetical protein